MDPRHLTLLLTFTAWAILVIHAFTTTLTN